MFDKVGFNYSNVSFSSAQSKRTPDGACFRLKQYFPNYIFSDVTMDGMAATLPDIKTILDGVTLGGSKVSDEIEVRNLKDSLDELIALVKSSRFKLDKEIFCNLHNIAAQEEALVWGKFRNGGVSIAGTSFKPPAAESLPSKFSIGVEYINSIKSPVERAIVFFLFGALNQFFFDANKRVSRLMMNGVLMSHGYDAIVIPVKEKQDFNLHMVNFYNTRSADGIMRYLLKCYNLANANLS